MQGPNEHQLLPRRLFFFRFVKNIAMGLCIIIITLGIGMMGYHHYENMRWVDSFENAAMILSGMGPTGELKTDAGKIFAGLYAIFSGTLFLIIIAIVFAPVIKLFLHKFHVKEDK
jgi:hypothetical protein